MLTTSVGLGKAVVMRLPRIKQEGDGGGSYHVMSRVAEGRFIFDTVDPKTSKAVDAEKFREMTCPH